MAIDTATKRSAALATRQRRRFFPVPDGTIGAADRAHVVGRYYVVSVAALPQTPGGGWIGNQSSRVAESKHLSRTAIAVNQSRVWERKR